MENRICVNTERKYGLWSYNEEKNMAVRKCKCCGIEFFYPVTKNILNQIKKQYEAIPLLESFLKILADNPNLIGYLNVILEDVVDYTEDTTEFAPKELLDSKLNELNLTAFISDENKLIIENFRKAIKNNDNDLFFDTMEYFKNLNADSLANFVSVEKNVTR